MLKAYLLCAGALAVLGLMLGLALPWLFSAKSTEAVILGMVLAVLTPLVVGLIVRQAALAYLKGRSNEKK